MRVKARHQSGYWANVDSPLYVQNARRMRAGDCTIVTRTECTNQASNQTLKRDFDGEDWGFFHPKMMNRPVDCSLEWDKEFWTPEDQGLKRLTDFRVTTQGGVRLLPSAAPWTLLRWLGDQQRVLLLLSAAHNNLDNTGARAKGWLDEADTFSDWQNEILPRLRRAHPNHRIVRLHQADVNKNLREQAERAQVQNRMLRGTGLDWRWNVSNLPAHGTHGGTPGQIIDFGFTDMDGITKRMAGDGFSDHDPIENNLRDN